MAIPIKEASGRNIPADWLDRCEDLLWRCSLIAAYRNALNGPEGHLRLEEDAEGSLRRGTDHKKTIPA